eukprot:EG_transcript_2971
MYAVAHRKENVSLLHSWGGSLETSGLLCPDVPRGPTFCTPPLAVMMAVVGVVLLLLAVALPAPSPLAHHHHPSPVQVPKVAATVRATPTMQPSGALQAQLPAALDLPRQALEDYHSTAVQQLKFATLRIVNDVLEYMGQLHTSPTQQRLKAKRRLVFGGRPVYLNRADYRLISEVNQTLLAEQWAALVPALDYLHPSAIQAVHVALRVAVAAHAGQRRKSGEWYISHPVAVAGMLAQHRMELDLVIAALLHDTVEDTGVTLGTVVRIFGHTVAALVEGVTKITELPEFEGVPSEEKKVINLQSMLLYMANDYRIVLLKLFDRLHNMRTLQHMRPPKQRAIAEETLAIFVPIARRLGLTDVRVELEHLSFQYLYPEEYRRLTQEFERRKETVAASMALLKQQLVRDELLQRVGITVADTVPVELRSILVQLREGRPAPHGTLGLKVVLAVKTKPGEDFSPYFVRSEALLYESMHQLPLPVVVREHVVNPSSKESAQSPFLWEQQPLNVFMFPTWMDPSESPAQGDVNYMRPTTYEVPWLTPIRDWAEELQSAREFVDIVQREVLGQRVVVELADRVLDLAAGATVLDAAFHVDLKLALHLEAGVVNGQVVPLQYVLRDGERLAFRTSGALQVTAAWTGFVHTYEAGRQLKWWLLSEPTRKPRLAWAHRG